MSLISMPEAGAIHLTDDEIAAITGSAQAKLQLDWLKSSGWAHAVTRSGRPVVGRLYANLKLAGVEFGALVQPDEWSPDMRALN